MWAADKRLPGSEWLFGKIDRPDNDIFKAGQYRGPTPMTLKGLVPVFIFIAGIGIVIAAVATGEAEVQLFLIFPVFTGSSWMFIAGTLLILASIIVGMVLLFTGQGYFEQQYEPGAHEAEPAPKKRNTEFGGAVLIGPIPIAFGSNERIALWMLIAVVIIGAVIFGLLLLAL